jgi:hypothetical protein
VSSSSPRLALEFVIILFPFLVGIGTEVGAQEQAFAALFAGWVVGWVTRFLLGHRKLRIACPPSVIRPALALAGLLVFGAVHGLVAGNPPLDVARDLSQFAGYLLILPMLTVIRDRRAALRMLWILLVIGVFAYMWNTWYWVSLKYDLSWPGWPTLSVGAAYLGPFLAALWALVMLKTRSRTRQLATCGVAAHILLATMSGYRSRILEVMLLACFTLWAVWVVEPRRRAQVVVAGVLLLTSVGALVGGTVTGVLPLVRNERILQTYRTILEPERLREDLSLEGYLIEANAALRAFLRQPVLGVGLGKHVEMEWAHGRWYQTAFTQHIWFTEVLMKWGVMGSLLFLWFFLALVRFALGLGRQAVNPVHKALALGFGVWVMVSLVPSVGHIGSQGFSFVIALMVAVLPQLCRSVLESTGLDANKERESLRCPRAA